MRCACWAGLAAACLRTDYPPGLRCSTEGTCPPGQQCAADGRCRPAGARLDAGPCPDADSDAGAPNASPDAAADAAPDAGPACIVRIDRSACEQDDECATFSSAYRPTSPDKCESCSGCDPVDQCGCGADTCYPEYDPRGGANTFTVCRSAGVQPAGAPCGRHEECAPGLFCLLGEFLDGTNRCVRACDDPCDCPEGEACLPYFPPYCRAPAPCNPTEPEACGVGGCIAQVDISGRTVLTGCVSTVGFGAGEACEYANQCRPGLGCAGGTCRRFCDDVHPCSDGLDCVPVDEVSGCPEIEIAYCLP